MSKVPFKKRDDCKTIDAVVARNCGMPTKELLSPHVSKVKNMEEGCRLLQSAIDAGKHITIFGDYDADGVTSTATLWRFLTQDIGLSQASVTAKLPTRKEGYGMSMQFIDDLIATGDPSNTLLITVDNGITAIDEIEKARAHGAQVLVIDHHLPAEGGILPPADVIIDPHTDLKAEFNGYCACGLAYKFIKTYNDLILTGDFDERYVALAAIATVADVMPLICENRIIVQEGLKALNEGPLFPGLESLIYHLGILPMSEEDIAFKVAPTINAASRTEMLTGEAARAFELLSDQTEEPDKLAKELISNNNVRVENTAELIKKAHDCVVRDCLYAEMPLVIPFWLLDNVPVGMVGLVAGKLVDEFHMPVIVLTENEPGILHGSMRTYGGIHCKDLLDASSAHLLRHGGHAGAAGLTVKKEDFYLFKEDLLEAASELKMDAEAATYDLEIKADQIKGALEELEKYAPYGEGNRMPVFKVTQFRLFPKAGKFFQKMGSKLTSLKLFGKDADAVCFDADMTSYYEELDSPTLLTLYGELSVNRYNSPITGLSERSQVRIIDMERDFEKKPSSSLANALRSKMASF